MNPNHLLRGGGLGHVALTTVQPLQVHLDTFLGGLPHNVLYHSKAFPDQWYSRGNKGISKTPVGLLESVFFISMPPWLLAAAFRAHNAGSYLSTACPVALCFEIRAWSLQPPSPTTCRPLRSERTERMMHLSGWRGKLVTWGEAAIQVSEAHFKIEIESFFPPTMCHLIRGRNNRLKNWKGVWFVILTGWVWVAAERFLLVLSKKVGCTCPLLASLQKAEVW
jgi:hypothetical protein